MLSEGSAFSLLRNTCILSNAERKVVSQLLDRGGKGYLPIAFDILEQTPDKRTKGYLLGPRVRPLKVFLKEK